MKILITNDDGIRSEGLRLLVDFARSLGEVTVIAPNEEHSGLSQSINLSGPFLCRESRLFPGVRAFELGSSPADCVRYAACGLEEHFDLMFSGINRGFNTGHDIAYSATCAAIFEAAYWQIPSVAFSTDYEGFAGPAKALPAVWDFFMRHRLLERHLTYNVNSPQEPGRILITRQKDAPYYLDHFEKVGEDLIIARGYSAYRGTADLTVDLDAVMNGYISVSPLTVDRTAEKAYEKLKGISR